MIRNPKSVPPEHCPPRPGAMISSLRAFGYDLPMAVADLIDNSIFANSRTIKVDYDWNEGNPWLRVLDDGDGMTEAKLKAAMRLGSQSPLDVRDEADLGRFGLGLKTASFSQCKLLTVYTKSSRAQAITRTWDLDHVCQTEKWELFTTAPEASQPLLSVLDRQESGTVVLCQNLDRLVRDPTNDNRAAQETFLGNFRKVARYLEIVFHRYLTGSKRVTIWVGRHQCQAWDPFLSSNQFTQALGTEYLNNRRVIVKPFVLPHVSKRIAEETAQGAGLYGWNAQQGFYIYRRNRMIISGGYLDLPFMPEEHYKLCRIQVDLPNDLDHEWSVDVRKAAASPPSNVRGDLERIARATRAQAAEVYRARLGGIKRTSEKPVTQDVWLKKRRGQKIIYQINQRNEAIMRLLKQINQPASWVKQLFHLVEKTVPHRQIIIDNSEHEDCQVDLPADFHPPPSELLNLCCEIFRERLNRCGDAEASANYACAFFDEHPAYRAALDHVIEEMQ